MVAPARSLTLGADLHEFLRDRLKDVFDGNISRFARSCHTSTSLASKWLAEDPARRSLPGPVSCQKIAECFDLDPDVVLALAGHRRGRVDDELLASSDPRRALLINIVRNDVPDEDLTVLERLLSGYRRISEMF